MSERNESSVAMTSVGATPLTAHLNARSPMQPDARSAASIEQAALRRDGYLLAAHDLAEPYPEDIFTPLADEEITAAVAAMNEVVPHASERLYAAWARHWSDVLRRKANEKAESRV